MSIVEQGVAVLPLPREQWWGAVLTPAPQTPNTLSYPLINPGAGAYWFSAGLSSAKMLRIYHPPRLWTLPNDATDPGYTWGVHWALGIVLGSEGIAGICNAALIAGSQIQLSEAIADGRTNPSPTLFIPTPGVPEYISTQVKTHLTVALILASGLTQTVCCPTQLALCESWST